jgi:hypothetical protein
MPRLSLVFLAVDALPSCLRFFLFLPVFFRLLIDPILDGELLSAMQRSPGKQCCGLACLLCFALSLSD